MNTTNKPIKPNEYCEIGEISGKNVKNLLAIVHRLGTADTMENGTIYKIASATSENQ